MEISKEVTDAIFPLWDLKGLSASFQRAIANFSPAVRKRNKETLDEYYHAYNTMQSWYNMR